jgi:hypothetical protein
MGPEFFFFFLVVLGLELSPHLEPLHQPSSGKVFVAIGSCYLPGLASNRGPPDLCLLSS